MRIKGEWDNEPDRLEFEHNGFQCRIIRHPELAHLCGYVGLPPGHPYFGKHYDKMDVRVHGGITFAGASEGRRLDKGYWWIGFDCAHTMDLSPGMLKHIPGLSPGVYRNIAYVTNELKELTEQLTPEGMLARELDKSMKKGGEQ